jgi:hypothetical protein
MAADQLGLIDDPTPADYPPEIATSVGERPFADLSNGYQIRILRHMLQERQTP